MAKTIKKEDVLWNFQMAINSILQQQRFTVDDKAEQFTGKGEAINSAFARWDELRGLSWGLGIQHELEWTPQK